MKKLTAAIITMLILASAVYAVSGDTLILRVSVSSDTPQFTMVGSLDSSLSNAVTATQNGTTLQSSKNIHNEAVDVYLKIFQSFRTVPAAGTNLTISVEATALSTVISGRTILSGLPNYADVEVGQAITNSTDSSLKDFEVSYNSQTDAGKEETDEDVTKHYTYVVFGVEYESGAVVPADTLVGSIHFIWPQKSDLESGEYEATITMKYENNN